MHKKLWIFLLCVIFIFCLLTFSSCSNTAPADISESSTETSREYETLNFDVVKDT